MHPFGERILEPLATSESLSVKARTLAQVERDYIIRVLEEVHWKIEGPHGAAEILGLSEHASHSNGET